MNCILDAYGFKRLIITPTFMPYILIPIPNQQSINYVSEVTAVNPLAMEIWEFRIDQKIDDDTK